MNDGKDLGKLHYSLQSSPNDKEWSVYSSAVIIRIHIYALKIKYKWSMIVLSFILMVICDLVLEKLVLLNVVIHFFSKAIRIEINDEWRKILIHA